MRIPIVALVTLLAAGASPVAVDLPAEALPTAPAGRTAEASEMSASARHAARRCA